MCTVISKKTQDYAKSHEEFVIGLSLKVKKVFFK